MVKRILSKSQFIALMVLLLLLMLLSQMAYSQNQAGEYSLIAFESSGENYNQDIFLIDPYSGRQFNLTATPTYNETSPAWSPDGQYLVFAKGTDEFSEVYDIYTMDRSGSNLTQLTDDVGDNNEPIWSPDGQYIAFTSNRDGDNEIYIMNSNGSEQKNLTENANEDINPSWSPDGAYIFFTTNRDGNWEIYRMEIDGGNPTNVTNNPGTESHLVWAPLDTSYVYTGAYTHDYEDEQGTNHAELYLLKNHWTDDEWNDTVFVEERGPSSYFGLSWSPDGRELASYSPSDDRIRMLDVETFARRYILLGKKGTDAFAWSPFLDSELFIPIATPTLPIPDPFHDPAPECPNAPPSRLGRGMVAAAVLPEPGEVRQNLRVRASPGGEQVGSLEAGQEFRITGQGVCEDDGLLWWPIKALDSELEGWSAEGFAPDDYLMVPLRTR